MRLFIVIETNSLANQMLSTGQLLELVRPDKVFAFQPQDPLAQIFLLSKHDYHRLYSSSGIIAWRTTALAKRDVITSTQELRLQLLFALSRISRSLAKDVRHVADGFLDPMLVHSKREVMLLAYLNWHALGRPAFDECFVVHRARLSATL